MALAFVFSLLTFRKEGLYNGSRKLKVRERSGGGGGRSLVKECRESDGG